VCSRWRKFFAFVADVGPRPSPKHSIERIDNDGNYEPDNCRWATNAEQSRNMRTNRRITINGRTQILTDFAREAGLSMGCIYYRLKHGWTAEEAFTNVLA
jgi:hypothetical protein